MKLIYIIAALVLASAETVREDDSNTENAVDVNKIMDLIYPSISKFIKNNGLDPMSMPDVDLPKISSRADLWLTEGSVSDLSKFHRDGDATLSNDDKEVRLDFGLKFDGVTAGYDYLLRFRLVGVKGRLTAVASPVHVKVIVSYDKTNHTLVLTKLKIDEVGTIKVKIFGNRLFDWLTGPITDSVVSLFRNSLISVIEDKAIETIQGFFDRINEKINVSKFSRLDVMPI